MLSQESEKLLSLKLVNLSKRDRNWILGRLPEQQKVHVSSLLDRTPNFNRIAESEFQELLAIKTSNQDVVKVDSQLIMSEQLRKHLHSIDQGNIEVTSYVKVLVKDWLSQ